jgi:hypothetical protein
MCLKNLLIGKPCFALKVVDILGHIVLDIPFVMEHLTKMMGWCGIKLVEAQKRLSKFVKWLWVLLKVVKTENGFSLW